jgi:hypothetical protein
MAAVVVAWLRDHQWTVYQEVQFDCWSRRADIVATQQHITWVIETKRTMCLTLLEQAWHWRNYANYVSVAIPDPARAGHFGSRLLKDYGIGLLNVGPIHVYECAKPTLFRCRLAKLLRQKLNEAQQTYAPAGNSEGKRWSPFQQTCDSLRRYLRSHPGASVKQVVSNIDTHYQTSVTARSTLLKRIQLGQIKGVRADKRGNRIALFCDDSAK